MGHHPVQELSRAQTVLMFGFISTVYLNWGLLFSCLPPFYPLEAEKRGATPAEYGFVFGILHVTMIPSSLLLAQCGSRVGAKRLFDVCCLAQSIASVAFAALDFVPDLATFLTLSYIIRFLSGICNAGGYIGLFSILMKQYPDRVASVYSFMEMAYGFGFTIGPAIGTFLYDLGGFKLPFFLFGTIGLLAQLGVHMVLPDARQEPHHADPSHVEVDAAAAADDDDNDDKQPISPRVMMTHPSLLVPYIDNFACLCSFSVLEAMLEPHMREHARASLAEVAAAFLAIGIVYIFTTLVSGYVCDKAKMPSAVSVAGNACLTVGMIMIGPSPFSHIVPTVDLMIGMSAIVGVGYSAVMVSTFARGYNMAMEKGYDDDMDSYLAISGVWTAAFSLGSFVGSTASGFLVQSFGFPTCATIFGMINLFMMLVDMSEWAKAKCFSRSKQNGNDYFKLN